MSAFRRLYNGETTLDYPRWWRRAVTISLVAMLVSVASFGVRGLNLGIDFEGGTSYEVRAPGASVADARAVMAAFDAADARIQTLGDDLFRIRSEVADPARAGEIRDALAADLGTVETFEQVGPTWGSEVTDKAARALLVFFVVVALYITVRLEWKMAVGALAAVAHDIVVSVGFYSVLQLEITPATVIAFLTIMGYSLYDTIVVYDKVRDVTGRLGATERYSYTELMNLALNRVTMRSINTSITSALPVVSLLLIGSVIMGAGALQEFGVALLLGIAVGSYSSLFLASSLVTLLKEREERWQTIAGKLRTRGHTEGPTRLIGREEAAQPDTRSPDRIDGSRGVARRRPVQTTHLGGAVPPRPRKKRR